MFEGILGGLGGLLRDPSGTIGMLQGVQGPPTPDGFMPKAVNPFGPGMGDNLANMDMADLAPLLQGLSGAGQRKPQTPPPSVSGVGGGPRGQIMQVALPPVNPASLRNRGR